MKFCFHFVVKLSTKMQNETQFLINAVVKINIEKFQQFFKIDFSRPLSEFWCLSGSMKLAPGPTSLHFHRINAIEPMVG